MQNLDGVKLLSVHRSGFIGGPMNSIDDVQEGDEVTITTRLNRFRLLVTDKEMDPLERSLFEANKEAKQNGAVLTINAEGEVEISYRAGGKK